MGRLDWLTCDREQVNEMALAAAEPRVGLAIDWYNGIDSAYERSYRNDPSLVADR